MLAEVIRAYSKFRVPPISELGHASSSHHSEPTLFDQAEGKHVLKEATDITRPPKPRRRLTDEHMNAVARLFREGKSSGQIAKELHMSRSSVKRLLNQAGFPPRKPGRRPR